MKVEPWRIPDIECCSDLLTIRKSELTDVEMRSIFLEHFSIHKDSIQVFTDGSKSVEGVGYAAVFPYKIIKRHLLKDASIYTAEFMAILTSLKEILMQRGKSYVIA